MELSEDEENSFERLKALYSRYRVSNMWKVQVCQKIGKKQVEKLILKGAIKEHRFKEQKAIISLICWNLLFAFIQLWSVNTHQILCHLRFFLISFDFLRRWSDHWQDDLRSLLNNPFIQHETLEVSKNCGKIIKTLEKSSTKTQHSVHLPRTRSNSSHESTPRNSPQSYQ